MRSCFFIIQTPNAVMRGDMLNPERRKCHKWPGKWYRALDCWVGDWERVWWIKRANLFNESASTEARCRLLTASLDSGCVNRRIWNRTTRGRHYLPTRRNKREWVMWYVPIPSVMAWITTDKHEERVINWLSPRNVLINIQEPKSLFGRLIVWI